jgi:hypothetical protein
LSKKKKQNDEREIHFLLCCFSGHLIKIDIRHSSHLEKSQLNVTPPVSGGKPIFSVVIKDGTTLFTYSFNRKVKRWCCCC